MRQAILDANANPGLDTIVFSIPGSGLHTINVSSGLPSITEAVLIDGTTQPIELDGSATPIFTGGLTVAGGQGSVIRNLTINRFFYGIILRDSSTDSVVEDIFVVLRVIDWSD